MRIKLLCVGKMKDPSLQGVLQEYLKRVRHYTPLTYQEIRAEKRKKTDNDVLARQRECAHLRKAMAAQEMLVTLDERGTQYSSEEFSRFIARHQARGAVKTLTFATGGATGVSDEFLQESDVVLSLSKMTFPHRLCRIILVEQLYRAYTILAGESYHK